MFAPQFAKPLLNFLVTQTVDQNHYNDPVTSLSSPSRPPFLCAPLAALETSLWFQMRPVRWKVKMLAISCNHWAVGYCFFMFLP